MANRRPFRFALPALVLALLGLTACGGGAGAGAEGSPGTSASASASSTPTPTVDARPTPASSAGPARNIPKPELPAAAKENTEAGFAAFTQYWFDTATYSLETGDTTMFSSISAKDCKVCGGYLSDASTGGWTIGPKWTTSGFRSDMKLDPLGQKVGYFMLDEGPSAWFDSSGKLTRERNGGNNGQPKAIYATFENGSWTARQLGQA